MFISKADGQSLICSGNMYYIGESMLNAINQISKELFTKQFKHVGNETLNFALRKKTHIINSSMSTLTLKNGNK